MADFLVITVVIHFISTMSFFRLVFSWKFWKIQLGNLAKLGHFVGKYETENFLLKMDSLFQLTFSNFIQKFPTWTKNLKFQAFQLGSSNAKRFLDSEVWKCCLFKSKWYKLRPFALILKCNRDLRSVSSGKMLVRSLRRLIKLDQAVKVKFNFKSLLPFK